MLKGMILVQFMSNMSSRTHDSLALHIGHTNILQPKTFSAFSDSFK